MRILQPCSLGQARHPESGTTHPIRDGTATSAGNLGGTGFGGDAGEGRAFFGGEPVAKPLLELLAPLALGGDEGAFCFGHALRGTVSASSGYSCSSRSGLT